MRFGMVSFSAKISLLTFMILWVICNFIIFPIMPNILLGKTTLKEKSNTIFHVTIYYCLIPSFIIYLVSKLLEWIIAKMIK